MVNNQDYHPSYEGKEKMFGSTIAPGRCRGRIKVCPLRVNLSLGHRDWTHLCIRLTSEIRLYRARLHKTQDCQNNNLWWRSSLLQRHSTGRHELGPCHYLAMSYYAVARCYVATAPSGLRNTSSYCTVNECAVTTTQLGTGVHMPTEELTIKYDVLGT